ncbi:alanine racemase [Rhodococcoides trifolii]|uniref:Alanine racemase n=1 Tax=Rhodococcoides trifolii TaxID=908250 RepID=A0A917CU05_9NOCA|nr:amino acid deaminase/aldolase [Rhodococcus trifolii]GGF97787.1 alanine racemase [Rhodococcus trifolii]
MTRSVQAGARPSARSITDRLGSATAHLDPPLLALDREALRANMSDLVRRAGGTPIRVASKSVRVRSLLDEVLAVDGFVSVMAYSVREAVWLARSGVEDILLGYPSVDREGLATVVNDRVLSGRITLMVDSPAHLDAIRAVSESSMVPPRICVDVDASLRLGPVHIGVRRSPLREPADVTAFVKIAQDKGFRVVGIMFYEAQIAGLPDANRAVEWMKRRSAGELAYRRRAVVDAVTEVVGRLEFVNSGGTGSLEVSAADPAVTEVTAGSGLFGPTLFDRYRAFTPAPALQFALPVVRTPTDRIATAFGGGYVASGPTGKSRVPLPQSPFQLMKNEGVGEVQTPLKHDGRLTVGDRVWFRHAKAGEVCERFTEVRIVEADGSLTTVPTYRGEGQCFG